MMRFRSERSRRKRATNGDLDTLVSEDEGGVGGGELGVRHCVGLAASDWEVLRQQLCGLMRKGVDAVLTCRAWKSVLGVVVWRAVMLAGKS
jgi:hypothetical protein